MESTSEMEKGSLDKMYGDYFNPYNLGISILNRNNNDTMIQRFEKEYKWLSNFAEVPIVFEEATYPSVEHAYMAAKNEDREWKDLCADSSCSAAQIKRLGKTVELIPDWDTVRLEVMKWCLKQKFKQEPFRTLLLDTGDQNIQEGNYWGDKYWGICLKTGIGENHLGRIIMNIRDEL